MLWNVFGKLNIKCPVHVIALNLYSKVDLLFLYFPRPEKNWGSSGKDVEVIRRPPCPAPMPNDPHSIYIQRRLCDAYGWNCPGRIFSQKIVTFFATLTPVFKHFLHWFYCFYYFYGSITCAGVGKTKFLTRHLRLGTWKNPLNMDDFQVFSHFFPFCISICML